jgi:hypothetical protein
MRNIIDENEVKRILTMHKSLKEQNTPPKPEMPTISEPQKVETPPTEDPLLSKLREAVKAGCLGNGKLYLNKTKNMYYFRSLKQSTKQEIDFYPDMTYKFVDGSKSGKWKCDNIAVKAAKAAEEKTKTESSDVQKQAFINKAINLGYKETLSADDVASGEYKKYKVPGSEPYFPPNGLEMWWSPSLVKSSTTDVSTNFEKLSTSQTIDKSKCRDSIKSYYDAYKTKQEYPQVTFDAMKRVVQSCVNTYEGKWGGIPIVNNIKKYVETLRGGIGGPSLAGEDSKWRLK